MGWQFGKAQLAAERKRLAGSLLEEVGVNEKNLAESMPLASKAYELIRGADQLKFLEPDMARQVIQAYEKIVTINDALAKYQAFRDKSAGTPGFDSKNAEFEQFISWYRKDLGTALEGLRTSFDRVLNEKV
jgi:hypothetical protein